MRLSAIAAAAAVTCMLGATAGRAEETVSFATSSTSMLNLPLYVADVMGHFEENGVKPDIIQFSKGGATALAAVISRNADIYIGSTASAIRAVKSGTDAVIIGAVMTEYSLNVVVSREVAEKNGITADSPLDARLKVLRGLTIGVTGAGSATSQIARYDLASAGYDPDRDARIAYVGSGGSMLGALASGNVNAIIGASPTVDIALVKQGGVTLINGNRGEHPGLKGLPQLSLVTTHSWLKDKPDNARAVVIALTAAMADIHGDDATVATAMEKVRAKYFPDIDKDVFASAWKNVTPAFPVSMAFPADGVQRNIDFLNEFSDEKVSIDAGMTVFTNDYIPKP